MIGTSRRDGLIQDREKLDKVANALLAKDIKILYVIGGDGSMKLAHSLWHRANKKAGHVGGQTLSVVGIPKTMDNDILWVWQSFGFMSAVEKARETLSILDTEIRSNPRLCVLQLFGSDSGYVVSHTVAASGADQCDAALIPEVPFSLRGLAVYLHLRMCEKLKTDLSSVVPSGLIVMAETAIPTDALGFVEDESGIPDDLKQDWREIREGIGLPDDFLRDVATAIGLSDEEKEAVFRFHRLRRKGERLQGQTSHSLRSAALRIVSCGLQLLLPLHDDRRASGLPQPDWKRLRIVTNEPRHLLRSIAPTCSDIIMGERLGTLAVENAMAGWTDFMISQWLTEYVLVPLPLVVLGRKRIPMQGMFWRSVLETTGQPEDLCSIGGTTRP